MASEWHLKIEEDTDILDIEGLRKLVESAPAPAGNIQVLAARTSLKNAESLAASLERSGFEVLEKHGNLLLAGRKREPPFYALIQEGTLIFLTRARKTEDIPGTVLGYLKGERRTALLSIPMRRMNALVERLLSHYLGCRVTFFTAHRDSLTPVSAAYRGEIERTVVYSGEDGMDTLEEMQHHYGIVPRILEFRLPHGERFRLDHRGIFTLIEGSAEPVFDALNSVLSDAKGQGLENWSDEKHEEKSLRITGLNPSPEIWRVRRFEEALETGSTAVFGSVFQPEKGLYYARIADTEAGGNCEVILHSGTLFASRIEGTLKFVVGLVETVKEHLSEEVGE